MANDITVVGAGMAGLLAAAMLRSEVSRVLEAQKDTPNNHSAVLRFRSSIVGDTLNIPFKKVKVIKASQPWKNPVADALSYSLKTNGTATIRSSVSAQGEIDERYIAPPDFISQMVDRVQAPILHAKPFKVDSNTRFDKPVISTLPMPVLAKMFGIEHPAFRWVEGYNINVVLPDVDAYATLYIPNRSKPMNRISITGNRLTIECALPGLTKQQAASAVAAKGYAEVHQDIQDCLELLGLSILGFDSETVELKQQQYAKILPIDERWRKEFIMKMSREYNIYSLGRFATWRPGLLLDDVVEDVRVIHRIIHNGSYDYAKG